MRTLILPGLLLSGLLLLGADSPDALALKKVAVSPVETFGLSDASDWRATDVTVSAAGQSFPG